MRKPHAPPNASRRRLLLGATALVATALVAGIAATRRAAGADSAAPRPLEIGLLPYLPTARLLAAHQPLRGFFEEAFRRPVVLSTAPDFHSFQRRVLAGDFDFTIIGPGPGWQAHVDRKHEVVAVSQKLLRILIVVARNSPLRSVAELRGQTVAVIDPLTVTSQTTLAMLRENKLEPGSDVRIRHEKTPFNSAQAVALGEVAAAGFPDFLYPTLPAELRDKLRIIHRSDEIPGLLFMARPAPDIPSPQAFQAALFRFAETAAGRAFVKDLNHDGLVKPDLAALRVLDRFVPETRRLMAAP